MRNFVAVRYAPAAAQLRRTLLGFQARQFWCACMCCVIAQLQNAPYINVKHTKVPTVILVYVPGSVLSLRPL